MSRSAKRVNGPGPRSVGDNDGESPALLATTTVTVRAFPPWPADRLVGLVVKASASRAEGPGFESRLRRDFFGVESYQ